ncbi:MAG: AAA family ATPase [Bacteroidetes bacterium]|nr:MAG: AAA family ATPase [Bacteroidota bacterium]
MFNRIYINKLREWAKENDRKPLVLRGARQTGKTSLIDIFARDFDQYIYLNLEKEKERNLFDGSYDIPQLLDAIFFLKNAGKNRGTTLLFIDEIQNSPIAVTTLRYFYEDAKHLYVIAAGSLLESLIDKTISFPVGRVDYFAVRPCTFEEYLGAIGEGKSLDIIQSGKVPDYAHDKLFELFRTYTVIGGMPEIIKEYIENRDLGRLGKIYERLIVSYQDDVEKYARNETMANVIRYIIGTAFQYAGSRITFEKFGHSIYRSREMGDAFRTLEKTMLLQLMYPVTNTRLPIEEKLNLSPKLLMLDTGLVNHSAGLQKDIFISKRIDEVYNGKVAEHIAGQELLALKPSVRFKLGFWVPKNTNSQAELDYVWPWEDMLIPVEVKAGATGRLRSLHRFVDEAPHSWAVRVYAGKYKLEDIKTIKGKKVRLINIPFYLVGQINKVLKDNIG